MVPPRSSAKIELFNENTTLLDAVLADELIAFKNTSSATLRADNSTAQHEQAEEHGKIIILPLIFISDRARL